MDTPPTPAPDADERARAIVGEYALGASLAMFAVPLPGADLAAVFAVWGRMIVEIGAAYGEEASLDDGKRLAVDLVSGALKSSIAWWTSAKAATALLRFVPIAGPITAALLDAAIAARGVRRVTTSVGLTAARYFRSGRTVGKRELVEELARLLEK